MKERIVGELDFTGPDIVSVASNTAHVRVKTGNAGAVNKSLLPGNFLRELERAVHERVGGGGAEFNSNLRSRIVQFWTGLDRAIHYEVWIHERTAQIELGLHFESTVRRNRELYWRFERELLAIHALLGSSIWLEEWDRGWSRIYETQPLWPLDSARVHTTADRIAEMVRIFQPILDAT